MNASSPVVTPSSSAPAAPRKWSIWHLVFALIAAGVLALIVDRAGEVDWPEVRRALRGYDAGTLAVAALLSLGGHAAAACFDLIGRRYVGHRLSTIRVVAINATAYAFSLNLGALAGGWTFRARLYLRNGLQPGRIAQIIGLAVITNWSGFVLLSGLVLTLQPPTLPEQWRIGAMPLRAVGALMLAAVVGYLLLCAIGSRRHWSLRIRGTALRMPGWRMALLQLSVSSLSWLLMAAALVQLLPEQLAFTRVLSALFIVSIAGAALHVPGGIGVLEGGVTQMLSGSLPDEKILAALLAFRALYYLVPFAIAVVVYLTLEADARRRQRAASR